ARVGRGAGELEDHSSGWIDVSEPEAGSRQEEVRAWLDADSGRVLMHVVEPHSHERLMWRQAGGGPDAPGSVEVAGQTVIGFGTSYGDGAYHLLGARGADGRLRALRIELREEWPPERLE